MGLGAAAIGLGDAVEDDGQGDDGDPGQRAAPDIEALDAKQDLLAEVWADTIVGDAVLKVCVREIRKTLDDRIKNPRFIETVYRRGYRFVGLGRRLRPAPRTLAQPATELPPLVGREVPLEKLAALLDTAAGGERQVVFVTGDAGVGKTSLLKLIAGLVPPLAETHIDCGDGRPLAGRAAYMAQQDLLLPWLTVLGNVTLGNRLRGDRGDRVQRKPLRHCIAAVRA